MLSNRYRIGATPATVHKPLLTTLSYSYPTARIPGILDPMRRSDKRQGRGSQKDPDRRAHTRFPLTLELRFTAPGAAKLTSVGTGRTIDLSSSGLRFIADRPLVVGQSIGIYVDWPVLLHGNIKMQLAISGIVVRTNGTEAAVHIYEHHFRTRSVEPKSTHDSVA